MIKTLTFGVGQIKEYYPRTDTVEDITEEQRKLIYDTMRQMARTAGDIANQHSFNTYLCKKKKLPPNERKRLRLNGYKDIFEELDIANGPMCAQMANGICRNAETQFTGEPGKALLLKGTRSLATFRTDGTLPLPIRATCTRVVKDANQYWLCVQMFAQKWAKENGLSTWVAYGLRVKRRDKTQLQQIENVISQDPEKKDWELRDCKVYRNTSRRAHEAKWKAGVVIAYPQRDCALSEDVVLGIDFGVMVPAAIHIREKGKPRAWAMLIGRGREILNSRGLIKNEIRRIVRALKSKHSGLMGPMRDNVQARLRKLRSKERRLINNASRGIAGTIADIAKREGAGIWQMEDLSANIKNDKWLARHWAPYTLKTAIEWQAKQIGAQIVYVDPRYTSQRCAKCGCIDRRNRPKGKAGSAAFKCVVCEHKDHADKNAARNLSMLGIDKQIAERANKAMA